MDPENVQIEPQPNVTNAFRQIITNVREIWNRLPRWFTPLLAFVFILSVFVVASKQKETQDNSPIQKEPEYLAVVSADPKGENQSRNTKIHIKFNLPVIAHHIEEFFYIAPKVKGRLVQGQNEYEVVYEPEESFEPGSYVTVDLKEGMPSANGKTLLSPYRFYFSIDRNASAIQFMNKDWSGKFMSFASDKGADITFKIGDDIANPNIRIYKADVDILLKSIVYEVPEEQKQYTTDAVGKYIETIVDSARLKPVKAYTNIKNDETINFKNQTGLYLFQGLDGERVVSNVWITLNEIGIHMRQDDKKLFLAAQNLGTQKPENGIDLTFYQLEKSPRVLVRHSLSNIQEYPLSFDQRLDVIVAKKGEDVMVIPVKVPNSQAEINVTDSLDRAHVVFLYTDRPIYKKGAKVAFRGLVRKDNDGDYQPSTVRTVKVSASKANWKFEKDLPVSSDGVFYGEYVLPNDIPDDPKNSYDNYASVSATVEVDGKSYWAYANYEIFEYTKPSYELEVTVDKNEYIKSDTLKATIKGKKFTGQPLANQTVTYSIFAKDYYETEKAVYNSAFNINSWGGMCGGGTDFEEYYGEKVRNNESIHLDQNGEAVIEFNTKNLKSLLSQEITILAEKTDENGNRIVGARGLLIHQGSFNVFFRPGPTRIALDDEFTVSFYAETLDGQKLDNKDFVYEIYEESWNAERESNRNAIKFGTVKTNGDGAVTFKEKVITAPSYNTYISVMTQDDKGNKVEAKKGFTFYKKGDPDAERYSWWNSSLTQTILKITSSQGSLITGSTARLEIIAPADMTILAAFERGRVYDPRWLTLTKGTNIFEFDVLDRYAPSITPTFSFFYQGKYYIEGLSLNVPAMHKLLDVSISTDKEKYNPGDTAIVTITTKDNNGNLVSADVGIGIVDKAIYALRKNATSPLHSSFYFYRRRTTNSSSSLSWIATFDWGGGGGGGGGGAESPLKDSDTLYWNPNLKTGSDGQIKVTIPVGQTQTTWQALVYASTDDTKLGQATKDFLVVQ